MNQIDEPVKDDASAFPASETTPGQAVSRKAKPVFEDKFKGAVWYEDYEQLRKEGWDWRRAGYIAWASSPKKNRNPKTQMELAHELNLETDRRIQQWRKENPHIDERVGVMQIAPLFQHRRDAFEAMIEVVTTPTPAATAERKLFFEITGDYKAKSTVKMQSWQDEIVEHLKDGSLTAQDVIDELGIDDARQLLIAAGAPIPASASEPAGESAASA